MTRALAASCLQMPQEDRLEQGAMRSQQPWAGDRQGKTAPGKEISVCRVFKGLVRAQAVVYLPVKVPSKSELTS